MKLFLSSQLWYIDDLLQLHVAPRWKKIALILDAWKKFGKREKWRIDMDIVLFEKTMWCEVIELCLENSSPHQVRELLNTVDGVYVCGGITSFLAEVASTSGFTNLMKEYREKWKDFWYIGTSAGSKFASTEFDSLQKLEEKWYTWGNQWLGFIDAVIIPHRGSKRHYEDRKSSFDSMYAHDSMQICLADRQALLVDWDSIEILTSSKTKEEIEAHRNQFAPTVFKG